MLVIQADPYYLTCHLGIQTRDSEWASSFLISLLGVRTPLIDFYKPIINQSALLMIMKKMTIAKLA